MELVEGREMFEVLTQIKSYTEDQARQLFK